MVGEKDMIALRKNRSAGIFRRNLKVYGKRLNQWKTAKSSREQQCSVRAAEAGGLSLGLGEREV